MSNQIETFYRKAICAKYYNLKKDGCNQMIDLDIKTNFPELYDLIETKLIYPIEYQCDCDHCNESKIIESKEINIFNNDEAEYKKQSNILRIRLQQRKNKLYQCANRTIQIINTIKYQIDTTDKDCIILVPLPRESFTIKKIIRTLLSNSLGQINQMDTNTLEYSGHNIYLLNPLEFVEGFGHNPSQIGFVLINGFYSHMYLKTIDKEEILLMLWKLRNNSIFGIVQDLAETFEKERSFISKLLIDLKLIY